ncbi:uncharacterized protein LOC112459838 [Temnothorax curvispinosus]|uniref:Uncharacterized protein LOC112459838 n=1 Tax=Temnothorax curvispinosus TaxID=300111 RepID=A0A6J1QCD5_9HYME|nr:uncharacterized protein LOC112459838 [Temnothorax curvispinosus]
MAAPVEDMEEVVLVDAETNENFKMLLSKEDVIRVRSDLTFATQLLQSAKDSAQQVDCTSPQPTTSNSNKKPDNLDTTVQCAEGAHAWTKQETLLLLELYREHQTDFISGKGTVKKHWNNIAKLMQEKGHDVNGFKCSTKFQSLKRTYKCITDHNKKSGNNRKDWEYLQIMQEIFGDKPWVKPLAVAGSHLDETESESDAKDEKENLPEKVTKKGKITALINDYISFSKEERANRREIRTKQHEEKLLALKRLENLLEKLVEKENK